MTSTPFTTSEQNAQAMEAQAEAIRRAASIPISQWSEEQIAAIRVYRQHLLGFARGLEMAAEIIRGNE